MKSFPQAAPRSAIIAVVTAGLCASLLSVPPAHAAVATPHATPQTASISTVDGSDMQAADLQPGLKLISEIPDTVLLAGDEAVQSWMVDNHPELVTHDRADVIGCAVALAFLIASTAIPAAKILKIRRLIASLGGVTKAVRLFWGASFTWEKIKALGGAAAALGAELLGIASVQQKCFA